MKRIHLLSMIAASLLFCYSCNNTEQQETDSESEQETTEFNEESMDADSEIFVSYVRAGDSLAELEQWDAAIENYDKSLQYTKDPEVKLSIEMKIEECMTNAEIANSPIAKVEKQLIGKRVFGVQFIWDGYGSANVTKENGVLKIDGKQFSKDKTEYCKLNGTIDIVDERKLTITGHLELYTHDCCGVIDETGTFSFLKSGNRKYWRWQDYDKYCSKYTCAYYLDIFE